MGQFDNPKSIALLFTGAFLISVVIIAFLNAELDSRSNDGTKIHKETLLESIERKITETISELKEKNAHRRSVLYRILVSGNATRSSGRRLMYFANEPDDSENGTESFRSHKNRDAHKLRHKKKFRRLTESRQILGQTNINRTDSRMHGFGQKPSVIVSGQDGDIDLYLKSVNNQTLKWMRWTDRENKTEVKSSAEKFNVLKEKFSVHENCYTMNDVLEIIAITCLVNFIFWFIIIACVNLFTRTQKISKSDRYITTIHVSGKKFLSFSFDERIESIRQVGIIIFYFELLPFVSGAFYRDLLGLLPQLPDHFPYLLSKRPYASCESLASLEIASDCEASRINSQMKGSGGVCRPSTHCRHNFLQDYLNSLMTDGSDGGEIDSVRSPELERFTRKTSNEVRKSDFDEDESIGSKWNETVSRKATKGNVFLDMIPLDKVKPFGCKKDKRFLEKRANSIVGSLSMENLIF